MKPKLEPLSDDSLRLLSAERDFPPMPEAQRERAVARARAQLGTGGARPAARYWPRRPALLLAAALTLALAAVSFAALRDGELVEEAPAPQVDAPQPADVATVEAPTSTPEPELAEPQPEMETELPDTAPEGGVSQKSPRRAPADLYALELAVLQRARAAVAGRQFGKALEAIAEHQRRFPAGSLREEREALRVRALAGLGKDDEARKAAEHFRERFPDSVLSPRIEESTRKER